MAARLALLPLAARRAAWDATWRVLLREPHPAGAESRPQQSDRSHNEGGARDEGA